MAKQLPPLLPLCAKFTDQCGRPLKGGKVFIYEVNSLIPKKTYADAGGTYENTHPIALDHEGCANIYYDGFARVAVYDNRGTKIHDLNNHGFPSMGSSTGGISQKPTISASGMPIGSVYWWAGKELPRGAIPASGQLFERTEHPILWEAIEQGRFHIIPDADWLAYPRHRAMFSLGDGVGTFRLPDINGAQKDSIKAPVLRGSEGAMFGTAPKVLSDAMRKITGTVGFNVGAASAMVNEGSVTGAFKLSGMADANIALPTETGEAAVFTYAEFDSTATGIPHADEIRPNSAFGCYVIQVNHGFDIKGVVTSVNGLSGDVDIKELLTLTDDIGLPNPPTAVTINELGVTEGESPTVSGTGEDGQTVTLKIHKDDVLLQQLMTTVGFDNTWSIQIAALSFGTYTVTAEHTDSKGNKTTAATLMTLIRGVIPVTLNNLGTQNTDRPTISGTGEAGQSVDIEIKNSATTVNLTALVLSNKTWSVISNLLANGDYVVTATHTDIEGNTTTATELLKIDTEAPSITINTPATSSNNVVTITGTGEIGLNVRVTGAGIDEQTIVLANGTWSITATLAIGTHTLTATITDEAGNTATATSNEFEMIDPNSIGLYDPAVNQSVGYAMSAFGLIGGPYTTEPSNTWSLFLTKANSGDVFYIYITQLTNPSTLAYQKIANLADFSGDGTTTIIYNEGSTTSGRLTPTAVEGHSNWYTITVPQNSEIKSLAINLYLPSANGFDIRNTLRVYKGELPNDVLNPVAPAAFAAPMMSRMMVFNETSEDQTIVDPVLPAEPQNPTGVQQVEQILGLDLKDKTARTEIVKLKERVQNQSESITTAEQSAVSAQQSAQLAGNAAANASVQAEQAVQKVDNLKFKTINNQSILGYGNINIEGGGGGGSIIVQGSRLEGKNWLALGDSITEGTRGGLVQYFSETGANVTNQGSSGATTNRLFDIVHAGKGYPRRDTVSTWPFVAIDFASYDVITIQIGTNNTEPDTSFGNLEALPITKSVADYVGREAEYWALFPSNFYGSLCASLEEIQEKAPSAEIYLITPPFRERTLDPKFGVGKYLQHRAALKAISERYGVRVIDAIAESGISYKGMNPNTGAYTYDGTHFNELGNKVWGRYIARQVLAG